MLASEIQESQMKSTNRMTLRLPNHILKKLKKEAEKKDLPLNAVITKILSKNTNYEMEFNAIPSITMSHNLFLKMIDKIDEENLEKISVDGPDVIKKLFTIIGVDYNLDNITEKYFIILAKYCGWFKFTHTIDGNHYRFVFETSFGSKWTKFLLSYVKNILHSLKIHLDNESIHDNVILFEFKTH